MLYFGIAEGVTPVTAQAQEPIGTRKSGERWHNQPPKGQADCNAVISQVSRTDGAQNDFRAAPFLFYGIKSWT